MGAGTSIRDRLGALARERSMNTQAMVTRWVGEGFLQRLSATRHSRLFVLKGAYLFGVWAADHVRSTTDVDLHGLFDGDEDATVRMLTEAAHGDAGVDDGIVFQAEPERSSPLVGSRYPGLRLVLVARVGSARVPMKVDIVFGHPITPGPEVRWLPRLLPDVGAVRLLCYPRETVIAEKLAIAVEFGRDNTRLKDYHDLWILLARHAFQGHDLLAAVTRTFRARDAGRVVQRRDGYWEVGFSPAMATSAVERAWREWATEHAPHARNTPFASVVLAVEQFGMPLLNAVRDERRAPGRWIPGQGWSRQPTRDRAH